MAAQAQVSWIQFQVPDPASATPNPLVPVNGNNAGCGCDCDCPGCNNPNRPPIPELGPGPALPPERPYTPPIPQLGPSAPPALSGKPIRFANGEIFHVATDVHSDGGGFPWGHTRSFASLLSHNTNVGNGYNWQVQQWRYNTSWCITRAP